MNKNSASKLFMILLVAILALPNVATQASPAVPTGMTVLSSGENFLVVDYRLPGYAIEKQAINGIECDRLVSADMASLESPGQPQLLAQSAMIGIPQAGEVRVTVQSVQPELLPGKVNLCPVPELVVETDVEGQVVKQEQRWVRDESAYTGHGYEPQAWAAVENTGMIRSQRVGVLRILPFHYDPASGKLEIARHLVIRLDFPGSTGRSPGLNQNSQTDEGIFEPLLQQSLLNYSQARPWRLVQSRIGTDSLPYQADTISSTPAYKILVAQDGIYELTYQDLQDAGVPVDTFDPQTLKLTNLGSEVPRQWVGDNNGIFEAGEYFLFYGQKLHTRFTSTNVYWLTWGGSVGKEMDTLNGTPGSSTVPTKFTTTQHMEVDFYYQASRPSGVQNDRWYWDYLQVTSTTLTKDFTTNLDNISTEAGSVVVRGLLRSHSATPEHHTRIYLNGKQIDDATWQYGASYSFEKTVAQSDLLEGLNTITLEALYGGGVTQQIVFVNWFEIDYADTYTAEDNILFLDGDGAGSWDFQVKGFTSNTIDVYDITVPNLPKRILNAQVVDLGGSYRLDFHQTLTTQRRFLALTPAKWLKPVDIVLDTPSDLHNTAQQSDYLLITHVDFMAQAQQLAQYRQGQGLQVAVVDVQDIYDEFSAGIFDPQAIRDFIAYTYTNWADPAPVYVLLFGDGHYDFQNFRGSNMPFFIPPWLADVDPWGGETAADNRFVTVSGADILPDMHIGRLPAQTTAEAQAMVDKIISYESNPPVDAWNTRISFVADNPDSGGDFYTLSNNAISLLPGSYTADKIYYGQNYGDAASVKAAIKAAINTGRLLVSYVGHGSTQWWGAEKFLEVNDIGSLINLDRPTFMVPMTCLDGYFVNPTSNAQALAELIVRAQGKGALASWSPTGQGVATGHEILQAGLFKAIFDWDYNRLGPATTRAKVYLAATTSAHEELIDTYVLFGDPATRLYSLEAFSSKYLYLPLLNQH